jgi:hypothetical protein
MRGVFGLVSLLVAVGLIVWLFSAFSIPTVKQGEKARVQVEQISGRGTDGVSAGDSFAAQAQFKGGTVDSLLVTNVVAGGAMQKHFGLAAGDEIKSVNGMAIGGLANDEELAKALVTEAFSRKQSLTVRRGSQTLTLPIDPAVSVAADPAKPSTSATLPPPVPAPQKSRGIQGQIEDIQNAAGGASKQE